MWMNCVNTQDGDAMPREVPAVAPAGQPGNYQRGCGQIDGLRKIRKAAATVPAPDSYPHVTCGSESWASADVPLPADR